MKGLIGIGVMNSFMKVANIISDTIWGPSSEIQLLNRGLVV